MLRRNFFGYETEIDATATAQWYLGAEEWGCECGDCRNFLAHTRAGTLPREVTAALDALQIPPAKATYVGQLYEENDLHLYQFSYRIAGSILSTPGNESSPCIGRCCHEPYPYGAPSFPEPHFDLEFYAKLPWKIEKI